MNDYIPFSSLRLVSGIFSCYLRDQHKRGDWYLLALSGLHFLKRRRLN